MSEDEYVWRSAELDLGASGRLASWLALILRPGDCVTLGGELGAGKTTFVRALIGALSSGTITDVPSPTYALVQCYDCGRLTVHHFDLYRLSSANDAQEIGLDDALRSGVVLIEWPALVESRLPTSTLRIAFEDAAQDDRRTIQLTGYGAWRGRLQRLKAMTQFVVTTSFRDRTPVFLQGDASIRAYARLIGDGTSAVLMDSPPPADGPPVRDGKSYNQVAHRAETVRAFVAVAQALRSYGLAAPEILAQDLDNGFLILDDLGDDVFGVLIGSGRPIADLYGDAVEVLLALRPHDLPAALPVAGSSPHPVPIYDRGAYEIELELLPKWYWLAMYGSSCPDKERLAYLALWHPLIEYVMHEASGWVLRDFHSPNLLLREGQIGLLRTGLIDFQDALRGHRAYDLASLLQDARLDVPAGLESTLLDRYCEVAARRDVRFNNEEFRLAYAILGAQRSSKILGIFTRLAVRDGKPGYLRHIPRLWRYLERNFAHPGLRELAQWYDRAFPIEVRDRVLKIQDPGAVIG